VVSEKFLIKVTIRSGFSRTVLYYFLGPVLDFTRSWIWSLWPFSGKCASFTVSLNIDLWHSQCHGLTVRFKGKISKKMVHFRGKVTIGH